MKLPNADLMLYIALSERWSNSPSMDSLHQFINGIGLEVQKIKAKVN